MIDNTSHSPATHYVVYNGVCHCGEAQGKLHAAHLSSSTLPNSTVTVTDPLKLTIR